MKIYFETKKLLKQCSEQQEMVKHFGQKMSKKLQQRLFELKAAGTLSDISRLPPARCHKLVNRRLVFSVDLEYPFRLLFIPANDPVPLNEDESIDRKKVTEIEIIDIEDTHDQENQRRGSR